MKTEYWNSTLGMVVLLEASLIFFLGRCLQITHQLHKTEMSEAKHAIKELEDFVESLIEAHRDQ